MCRNGSTTKVGYNYLQVDFASSAIGLCCQWQNAWQWETNCQIIAHCRILGSFLLIFECEIWFCWFQSMFVSGCSKSALYSCKCLCLSLKITVILIFYLQSVPVDFCISYCLWSVWNHFGWWVLEQKNKWKWTHSVKLVKFIFLGKNRNIKSDFFFLILGIGLLYVNASVWQMLRGSIIIFTGVLSVSMVQFTF